MLILCYFECTRVIEKYQNKTTLNCGFRFAVANLKWQILISFINQALCDNVIFYNNSQ